MKPERFITLVIALALAPTLRAQTATQVWAVRRDHGIVCSVYGCAVDSAGNAIITGYFRQANSFDAFYTTKYAAASGAVLWEKSLSSGQAYALVVDSSSNVLVAGRRGPTSNLDWNDGYDLAVAKYAGADGTLLWARKYDVPPAYPGYGPPRLDVDDRALSIAIDSTGGIAIAGDGKQDAPSLDYATVKYASDGTQLWARVYGAGYGDDSIVSVGMDSAGNVAVAGNSYNGNNTDYYTVKYASADGHTLWSVRYNGPDDGNDLVSGMVVDAAGNVIVTGYSVGATSYQDYYTAKYASADGALLWERRYNGPANSGDIANGLAVDGAGNIAVTGSSGNANLNYDYYTVKYAAANGALLWENRYSSTPPSGDYALATAVDSAGNVVVTGLSNSDYYTAKYAVADGHLLWEARYDSPGSQYDRPKSIALTPDGGAVVTGNSYNAQTSDPLIYFATVLYAPPTGDADGDGLQDWWEQMWWGATAGHAALDDFDHDGIPELLEMAFGLNPKQPDNAALTPVANEGGYLTITITKHPGVTYQVQTAATPDAPAFTAATTTVLVDNATTLKVRDNIPIGTPPARYLRVKVTAAP